MPVSVIITIFIVLVVGTLVVMFAQNTLQNAEKQISNIGGNGESEANRILEVKSLDSQQVASLSQQCFDDSFGKTIESEICFFVHSEETFDLDSAGVFALSSLDEQSRLSVQNATNIKSLVVKWNAKQAIVEVSS